MAIAHQLIDVPLWTDDDLRRIVQPDPVRPGFSRYRVVIEHEEVNVPILPLIGQLRYAYGWDPDAKRPQLDKILTVAHEYSIPPVAMEAAILYYQEHRSAIDSWLANNQPETEHSSLADFLSNSPLRGAEITIERSQDQPRDINL